MMPIKSWQAVLLPAAISFVLAAAEIPSGTWFTTAAISQASGVAALTLMATAAMLGGRWGFVESWFGVLVWIKEFRYWMLLGGVLLHAGIDYSMNLPLFGFIICTAYITFVEPADLQRLWEIIHCTRQNLKHRT